MTSHFTGTTKNRRWSHRKQRLKRWVFRRLRKTGSEGADVTCGGRPFQMRAASSQEGVRSRFWTSKAHAGLQLYYFFPIFVHKLTRKSAVRDTAGNTLPPRNLHILVFTLSKSGNFGRPTDGQTHPRVTRPKTLLTRR